MREQRKAKTVFDFRSQPFWVGFWINLVFWIGVTLEEISSLPGITCLDCDKGFGIPFRLYESSTYCCPAHVVWHGVVLNALVVIVTGLLTGLIFRWVWSNLSADKNV